MSKELIAAACKMDVKHLDRLVRVKKLAGKSINDIERELERLAWMNGNKIVFINTKHPN